MKFPAPLCCLSFLSGHGVRASSCLSLPTTICHPLKISDDGIPSLGGVYALAIIAVFFGRIYGYSGTSVESDKGHHES
jgi:hypothetical protein